MRALAEFIQVYDGALSAQRCTQMIDSFNRVPELQQANGAGVRPGLEESSWTELNLSLLRDRSLYEYFARLVAQYWQRYNESCRLTRSISPVSKISDLIIKRYDPQRSDRFQVHFDSIGQVCNRYLVFLWYLNDVAAGGETQFPDLQVSIAPRAGRLLMFPPYWMFQHAGLPPGSGEKYILSTYALY